MELTLEELEALEPGSYTLLDLRSEQETAYGTIPGSVPANAAALPEGLPAEPGRIVLFCTRGKLSLETAERLRDEGFDACSLKGGYLAWLMRQMQREQDENRCAQIEKSIRTTYHKRLFSAFAKAIRTYDLVREGDRIAVCISGGKDSMLMAKLFQELQRHHKFPFELVFLVMDPGYNEANRRVIEHNARLMGVTITVFETNIFDIVYEEEKNPCYLCARMRRGHLYSKAKELGCNKIALGHHYDDVIETILMGMLYGAQVQTMMPKLHSTNFPGMVLIRPLYCVREEDIIAWKRYNDLEFIQCACRFTENCTTCDNGGGGSKRQEVKVLLRRLKRDNPNIENSIFRSIHGVALDTMPGYKTEGQEHSFLERFDRVEAELQKELKEKQKQEADKTE